MSAHTPEQIREAAREVLERDHYNLGDFGGYGLDFEWLLEPFKRFLDTIGLIGGTLSPAAFYGVLAILIVLLILLAVHIFYTFYGAVREEREVVELTKVRRITPVELEEQAKSLAQSGNWIDASRKLYAAALLRLEERREGRLKRSLTNQEYLRTFKSIWVIENLRVFAVLIDGKWYRGVAFEEADYLACQNAHSQICAGLQRDLSCSTSAT